MEEHEQLLKNYLKSGSGADFSKIVRIYGPLVYSTALRRLGQNKPLAEEVTQDVFALLAQNAERIREPHKLPAWLHRSSINCAANASRKEYKRKQVMRTYAQENSGRDSIPPKENEQWQQAKPFLDEAINKLSPSDRDALMLRYFENSSFKTIAKKIGKSEDTSRKQVSRAVEKLSKILSKRGIIIPTATLTTGLGSYLGRDLFPLSAHLASQLSLSTNLTTGTSSLITNLITTMSGYKITLAIATAIALIPPGLQLQANQKEENRHERAQINSPSTTKNASARSSASREGPSTPRSQEDLFNAIAAIAKLPLPQQRIARSEHLMMSLNPEELLAMLALLQDPSNSEFILKKSERHFLVRNLLTRWVRLDSASAVQVIDKFESIEDRNSATYGLVKGWAGINPEATEAYLNELPPDELPDRMMQYLWSTHAQADPVAALERALQVADPDKQAFALRSIVDEIAHRGDPSTALPYIESLEPGIDKERYLEPLLENLSQHHPDEAFTMALQSSEKILQQNVLPDIMQAWAETDPEEGMEALLNLPVEIRQNAVFEYFGRGLETLDQVGPALAQLENANEKCAVARGFILNYTFHPRDFFQLTSEEIGGLRTLIEDLPPGAARVDAQLDFASLWGSKESAQAIEWVNKRSHLDADAKKKFNDLYQR